MVSKLFLPSKSEKIKNRDKRLFYSIKRTKWIGHRKLINLIEWFTLKKAKFDGYLKGGALRCKVAS